MFPLLTIPLSCFHTFIIKYIQSQAAIISYSMPFKKLMFSLPLVCLSPSTLHITAKLIFQKNLCELGLSLQTQEYYPQPFLQKTIKMDFKVLYNLNSIYHAGLIFHYSLYIDINFSSNIFSIHRYFFYRGTIFLNILCLFSVSKPVLKVSSPNDIFFPSTLILPTTQSLP